MKGAIFTSKSILIVETPKVCRECPCYEIDGVYGSRCKALDVEKGSMSWSTSFNKRNDNCPLVTTEDFLKKVMEVVE